MEEQEEKRNEIKQMIDELVKKAKIASEEYLKLDQETVNNIIKAMSMAFLTRSAPPVSLGNKSARKSFSPVNAAGFFYATVDFELSTC